MDITAIILAIFASSGLWTIVKSLVDYRLERRKNKDKQASVSKDEFEIHSKALRGLLYGELERRCTALLSRGYVAASELNDLRRYYFDPYKALKGDGTIDRLMSRVEELDIKEE